MKPVHVALLPVAMLLGAAAISRVSAAGQDTPRSSGSGGILLRESQALTEYPKLRRATADIALGPLSFHDAEHVALETIETRAESAPADPVSVTWVENAGRCRVPHRVIYDPQRCLLFYQSGSAKPSVYVGLTRSGIETSLRIETNAAISTAYAYSFPGGAASMDAPDR